MADFSERNTESELMDNPFVEEKVLKKVFEDINRSNTILGGSKITMDSISNLITAYPQESYTILDMGCGDGSILRQVIAWSRRHGIQVECIGIDLSEKGLAIARSMSRGFPEIRYLKRDILTLDPKDTACDIVLCTLTMHHFLNHEIPIFLKKFTALARIGIVINDLQRSPLAYYLFRVFSLIFIRTKIAKHDGLISIKSGFTKSELLKFSKALPFMEHTIRWKWAFRYVWVMRSKRLTSVYE